MNQFTALEIENWAALYVAAGICCAFAMTMSVAVTGWQACQERIWTDVRTRRQAMLFLPRLWWRWQKLYFLSTPVTLGIVAALAASMTWS